MEVSYILFIHFIIINLVLSYVSILILSIMLFHAEIEKSEFSDVFKSQKRPVPIPFLPQLASIFWVFILIFFFKEDMMDFYL